MSIKHCSLPNRSYYLLFISKICIPRIAGFICISYSYTVFEFVNFALILTHLAYYNSLSRTGLLNLYEIEKIAIFAFNEGTITNYPTFVLPRIGIYIGIYYWKCHTVKEDRKKWFLCRVCVCSTSHACVKYGTELRITYLYILLIQGRLFHYIRHRGLLGPY